MFNRSIPNIESDIEFSFGPSCLLNAELSLELGRVVLVPDFIGPSGLVRVVSGPSCPAPFLMQLFLQNLFGIFLQKHVISSVEMVVSEIKDNKSVKTDISIFVFTLIVSAFIPPFLLFKGRNQATHNIRNKGFFTAVSSYTVGKTNCHTNQESCFQEKTMQNCPNSCTNLNSTSLSSDLLTATPGHNTCILPLYNSGL